MEQVAQPAAPAPAPATAPAQAQEGGGPPGPGAALGLDFQDHDKALRKWRLYLRIVAALFIGLAIILFVARGAKASSRSAEACGTHGSYSCYYYSYDYFEYDFISLPMVCAFPHY